MIKKTLEYFKEISKIPRASFKENEVRNYFIQWSKNRNFKYKQDKKWNICISIPWTKLREKEDAIILQWHMDMVCVKWENSKHNFYTDPIKVIEKDWWLSAVNTTLWADNGIWIAIAMSSVDLESHPPLEILLTVEEEVGMWWALNLDIPGMKWKYILNLDIEEEWIILIWSAWAVRFEITKETKLKKIDANWYDIKIFWAKWWHSWLDINKNRWQLIYDFLDFLNTKMEDIEVSSIQWWSWANVIPHEIKSELTVKDIKSFEKDLNKLIENLKSSFDMPDINYKISSIKINSIIQKKELINIFSSIKSQKTWIIKMSTNIDQLVRTSINLWLIEIKWDKCKIMYMARSSNSEDLDDITKEIENSFKNNYKIELINRYNWWEERKENSFYNKVKTIYDKVNLKNNKVMANHWWLEYWIIIDRLWNNMQWAAIWPNIKWAHTIKETIEIKSIWIICEVLKYLLKEKL